MRIRSYSKINLSLRVLKKLKKVEFMILKLVQYYYGYLTKLIIEKSKKDLTIFKGKFKKN